MLRFLLCNIYLNYPGPADIVSNITISATWQYGSWCFWHFSVIFCEAVAIYGVIVAIILQTKLESVPKSQIYDPESLRAGYAIFASGIIVGFANLVCGCVFFLTYISLFHENISWWMHGDFFHPSVAYLISIITFFSQVVRRNNWKQLCIIWCSELISLCEDSCDWDLW